MFLNPNRSQYRQTDRDRIGKSHAGHVRRALEKCPAHRPTPLLPLPAMAAELGVARIDVKAEWSRMGLTSFKALGGGYAVATLVMARAGTTDLLSPAVKPIASGMTMICASAGNHGLAVAAAARAFGTRAVVVLSEAVPEIFAHRLRDQGATVVRAGATYEDSMANAATMAEQNGWHLVSDSASPGNTETPLAVMQGYTVLLDEAAGELAVPATHIFVQAGVGGLAASAAAYLRDRWGEDFKFIVVESEGAPCLLESVRQGRLTRVTGSPTKLGRLDCKEPSLIALDLLAHLADAFLLVSDAQAEEAAARLDRAGAPVSPCGATGAAGLIAACNNAAWRKQLNLDANSRILIIGTEAQENRSDP